LALSNLRTFKVGMAEEDAARRGKGQWEESELSGIAGKLD